MLYAIVAMLAIIADQAVKYWVSLNVGTLSTGEKFIPGLLSLVNVQNDGAAFSILSGGGARIYFIILTGVFTVAVILALATNFIHGSLGRWSIVMVTAGGLSNCIDRVIYGYVQDMFKVELFDFAVFNLADVFITVFCLLFIVHILFGGEKDDDDGYDDEFADDDDEDSEDEDDDDEDERVSIFARRKSGGKDNGGKKKTAKSKYEDEYEQYKSSRAARQQAAQTPAHPASGMSTGHPTGARPAAASGARPVPTPGARPAAAPGVRPAAVPASRSVSDSDFRKATSEPESDPFAEWERANARAGIQTPSYAKPAADQVTFTDPSLSSAPAYTPAPPASESGYVRPAQTEQPAARIPQQPAAKKPAGNSDFSIDDILAEFK